MITTREAALKLCLSFPKTYTDAPFHDPNWDVVRCKANKKVFAWVYEHEGRMCINVKVSAEWRDFFRRVYPSVIPGYHLNKEHWNTILLDGSIPDDDVKRMVGESYDLVHGSGKKRSETKMAKEVYEALTKIPKGKVITYGGLAELSGHKGAARAVGTILHHNPDPKRYPCHRVVTAGGKMAPLYAFGGEKVQEDLLRQEGVVVENRKVDLSIYLYTIE